MNHHRPFAPGPSPRGPDPTPRPLNGRIIGLTVRPTVSAPKRQDTTLPLTPTVPLIAVPPESWRRLAARVIEQALKDLVNPAASATIRESARQFLGGSPMLGYWCLLLGLHAPHVTQHARLLMTVDSTSVEGMTRSPSRRASKKAGS